METQSLLPGSWETETIPMKSISAGSFTITKVKTHPDQKYIEALVNNNTVVLNELYKKFSGKIKFMVLKTNGTEADAADIFQYALMSIYRKAKTKGFRLSCPFEAFLYLVCKKRWI